MKKTNRVRHPHTLDNVISKLDCSTWYTLNFVISTYLMSLLLLYLETLENACSQFNLTPCCHDSLPYIMVFDIKNQATKEFKPHTHMHNVVISAMLTLYCFIISHATLTPYYHASILTLHTSSISRALWLPQE